MAKNKPKICGHRYTVIAYDEDSLIGTTSFDTMTIKINSRAPREIQEETLIHEILHCIFFHSSERDWHEHPEALIQAIANGLWQAGIRPEHFNIELP